MDQWRLIDDYPAEGGRNMAVDQTILESVIAGDSLPTVRFYGWTPFCLSLGYGQRAREVDRERLQARGYTLVRRPTGGKAVLHTHELTYSIALPAGHPLALGSIIESYRRLSTALIAALDSLGIAAKALPSEKPHKRNERAPICFEITSDYEIAFAGRKLIGSAQMRRQGAVLQHGSLPLSGDIAEICGVMDYSTEGERQEAVDWVRRHAITLEAVMDGNMLDRDQVVERFAMSFEKTFGIQFIIGSLTPGESARAQELNEQVYNAEDWTFRR